jgi:elongation factor Ts
MHNAARANLGKIGVLVAVEGNADGAKMQELGKHIAMHIAATNPISLNIAEVPVEAVNREKAIFSEQALASGKPANIVEKMVEGRIRKFYEEVVLEEQNFIMDPDKKVKTVVEEFAKENNANVKLNGFVCFKLGEGLQKKEEDFAAEVAAQLGQTA